MTWDRPYFRAGGDDAYVHYVVFGAAPQNLAVSKSKHRYTGVPGVGVNAVARGDSAFFTVEEPAWQRILATSGVDPAHVTAPDVQAIVSGAIADPDALSYLRDAVALTTALLETGANAVLDLQTLTFFSPQTWREVVFAPDRPDFAAHVTLLSSDRKLQTRGLRKFGRPDLCIPDVAESFFDPAVEVINRFANFSMQGGHLDPTREINVAGFPGGYFATLQGSLDDPDFNNRHWLIAKR